MAYLSEYKLLNMGFKSLGRNVKVSEKASVYDCEQIEIGDDSRIDDFCVVSGKVKIGSNVHITPQCLIAGGEPGLVIKDFVALAYGVKVFTQSDDYSGETLTNSTIPQKYKREFKKQIVINKHVIIGAGSIIMPGVTIGVGAAVGANSLLLKPIREWVIVAGSPAKEIGKRKKNLLELEELYLSERNK